MPGDEIVLIGFSRGSFTARSIAGLISEIGLLTRAGMNHFYAIFKDTENFQSKNYHDIFPTEPFPNKPTGPDKVAEYRERLVKVSYWVLHILHMLIDMHRENSQGLTTQMVHLFKYKLLEFGTPLVPLVYQIPPFSPNWV